MHELHLLAVDTLASDCGSIQQRLHSFSARLENVRPENTDAVGSEMMYKDGEKRQCSRASVRTIRSRFECGSMAWWRKSWVMGAQILIVLIFRTEPKGTRTKQKKRDNYREREEQKNGKKKRERGERLHWEKQ